MRRAAKHVTFGLAAAGLAAVAVAQTKPASSPAYELNDVHFHLTNYVQKGTDMRAFMGMMGDRVGRVAIFGIPLQQTWSYRISGDRAPTYYLDSDAPLYYYSFTDAHIAMAYRALTRAQQARLDPMITGFNPADMYAADHIRRVLVTFPGVFTGIGEFSIHKEFVSSKVAGEIASLRDPALDRILTLAEEVGLVVLLHDDIDTPFAKDGAPPAYADALAALFRRHPNATIIWAHTGVGRVVHPVENHAALLERLIADPALRNLHFDLSWSVVAEYLVSSPRTIAVAAQTMQRHPERFLFGTDEVAPPDQRTYLRVYDQYKPLLDALDARTRHQFLRGNYERLFDNARRRVRAWEAANAQVGPTSGL